MQDPVFLPKSIKIMLIKLFQLYDMLMKLFNLVHADSGLKAEQHDNFNSNCSCFNFPLNEG